MDLILRQIDRGLDRGFHYLAVVTALTLPDICGALESEDGWATKQRFKDWWERWMVKRCPVMTSDDAYALRSGVVHQGKLADVKPNLTYDRIVFMLTGGMHQCVSQNNAGSGESALQLDATMFCHELMDAVREWYEAEKKNPHVIKNLPYVLQFRPDGIKPHFVGMPVIA